MGWVRDRRGYGELRLPLRRRRARAGTWLAGELRHRRQPLLRRLWKLVVSWLATWVGLSAVIVLVTTGRPWLQGFLTGCYAVLATAGLWLALMVLDGSLLARLGRDIEEQVGDDLRRTRGMYGVVSGLRFERYDVDHVVLCPHGVIAVEVKYLSGHRRALRDTPRLADAVAQTVRGAASTRRLLASRGLDIPVAPLLVLAGPGAPDLNGELIQDGVARIAAYRDSARWLPLLAGHSPARLDLPTARAAASTLLAFQDQRRDYERHRPDPPPTACRRSAADTSRRLREPQPFAADGLGKTSTTTDKGPGGGRSAAPPELRPSISAPSTQRRLCTGSVGPGS